MKGRITQLLNDHRFTEIEKIYKEAFIRKQYDLITFILNVNPKILDHTAHNAYEHLFGKHGGNYLNFRGRKLKSFNNCVLKLISLEHENMGNSYYIDNSQENILISALSNDFDIRIIEAILKSKYSFKLYTEECIDSEGEKSVAVLFTDDIQQNLLLSYYPLIIYEEFDESHILNEINTSLILLSMSNLPESDIINFLNSHKNIRFIKGCIELFEYSIFKNDYLEVYKIYIHRSRNIKVHSQTDLLNMCYQFNSFKILEYITPKNFNKMIQCPHCRNTYNFSNDTIRIKSLESNCIICYGNKVEILCPKCCTVKICFKCAIRLIKW